MTIAKSVDIGEDATNLAVTTFGYTSEFEIKFSDHTNYSSFEKAVNAIDDELGGLTNTDDGLKVAYEEMFNPANGMRTDVPNVMIFMTDGACNDCDLGSLKDWNKKFRYEADPPIKLIGIGIGNNLRVEQIETFVGKENYVGTEITEIIKPEFIRSLSICDGMYSYLVLILIRVQMEFYFRHILISCEKYST